MKSYKYVLLHFSDWGVLLHSTDSQVLDWILAELKKVITNFRMSAGPKDPKLPSGETYYLHIDKLQGKDRQVGWWILKQLCLQGWEPFAVTDVDANIPEGVSGYYHLRLEVSAK